MSKRRIKSGIKMFDKLDNKRLSLIARKISRKAEFDAYKSKGGTAYPCKEVKARLPGSGWTRQR